jgi:ATP-dependent 26S proteasome regulatory subunit
LEEFDGDGLVIAATNLTENLDRALFRRFDEVIQIPLPTVNEIARLLEMSLSAMEKERGLSWEMLAQSLDGHSCSEVVRAADNAAKHSILEGRQIVSASDLKSAIEELNNVSLGDNAR